MVPWSILGLAAAMHTAWLERTHVARTGSAFSWTLRERFLDRGERTLVLPGEAVLAASPGFLLPTVGRRPARVDRMGCAAAAVILLAALWLARGRIGLGPLVAALFFGGTLVPALGFVNIWPMRFSFVADHYQYLASLGPIVLVAGGLGSILRHHRAIALAATGTGPGPLAPGPAHLEPAIDLPGCRDIVVARARVQSQELRGAQLPGKGPDIAGPQRRGSRSLSAALRLQTDDLDSHLMLTMLGNNLARLGEFDEAKACFTEALRRNPNDWEATYGLVALAARQLSLRTRGGTLRPSFKGPTRRSNRPAEPGHLTCIQWPTRRCNSRLQVGAALKPELIEAEIGLATVFARQQRFREAEYWFSKVFQQQPSNPAAQSSLARIRALLMTEPGTGSQ